MNTRWPEHLSFNTRFLYVVLYPNLVAGVLIFVYLLNLKLPKGNPNAPFADAGVIFGHILLLAVFTTTTILFGLLVCLRKWKTIQSATIAGVFVTIIAGLTSYGLILLLAAYMQT